MENISSFTTSISTNVSSFTALSTQDLTDIIKDKCQNINEKPSVDNILTDLTPSVKELKLHQERIFRILDTAINKLEIAICLPRLLRNNACILRKCLSSQEVEFVQTICTRHFKNVSQFCTIEERSSLMERFSAIIEKISLNQSKGVVSEKILLIDKSIDNLRDPYVAQVLEILWHNRGVRNKVLEQFDMIQANYSTLLVHHLKTLRNVMEQKFAKTAKQEKIQNTQLRKSWLKKYKLENQIKELQVSIELQRENLGNVLNKKNVLICQYLQKIEDLNSGFKQQLQSKIYQSEKIMAELSVNSKNHQEELAVQAKTAVQQYEGLLTRNMATEKLLRAKRTKIETQLCNWLNKYDADIGERNAEFEELTEGYEKEKTEMEELQRIFDEQEEEYIILFQQKEEEDQEEWEARAYVFLINRSARKIQRCWRAYRQRKIERRKARMAKAKGAKLAKDAGEKPKEKKSKDKKEKITKKDTKSQEARPADPMAALGKKFGDGLLDDLQGDDFTKDTTPVNLMAD